MQSDKNDRSLLQYSATESHAGGGRNVANVRNDVMQLETRLGAIGIALQQVRREMTRLHGFSLGNMMAALLGNKESSMTRLREQLQTLELQETQTSHELCAMRDELRKLQELAAREIKGLNEPAPIDPLGPSDTKMAAKPSPADLEVLRKSEAAIKKAMDAGDEAMKDLREEIETVSSLGRRRNFEKNLVMRTMMSGARRDATRQCASRVTMSISRFHRTLESAISAGGAASPPSLAEASVAVSGIIAAAGGAGFADTMTSIALDTIYTQLQTATMLAEKAHKDIRTRIAS